MSDEPNLIKPGRWISRIYAGDRVVYRSLDLWRFMLSCSTRQGGWSFSCHYLRHRGNR